MKKLVTLSILASALLLGSCTFKSNLEKVQKSKDSLQTVYNKKDQEANDYLSMINEVEDNMQKIKEAQSTITVPASAEGVTPSQRERIQKDFEFLTELIAQNKAKLEELQTKASKAQGMVGGLKKTIARLNEEMTAKEKEIADLKTELSAKNVKIQQLDSTLVVAKKNIDDLSVAKKQVEKVAADQDAELNAGYYFLGNSKELKESGIVIKKGGINKSKFTKIDIRETKTFELGKSGVVLTAHPAGSYKINIVDKKATLEITDVKNFWSISKYLVVKVKK